MPRYLCADDLAEGRLVSIVDTQDAPINTLYLAARAAAVNGPHIAHARSALLVQARLW